MSARELRRRVVVGVALVVSVAAGTLPAYLLQWTHPGPVRTADSAGASSAVAPPVPAVSLAAGSDSGIPGDGISSDARAQVAVTAAGASGAYTVRVYLDGSGTPLSTREVRPGTGVGYSVELAAATGSRGLADGVHTVRAVASAAGGSSAAPPLRLRIVTGAVGGTRITLGGNADGMAGTGDTVTLGFTRSLLAQSICSDWDSEPGRDQLLAGVLATLGPDGAGNAVLDVAPPQHACGFVAGRLALGRVTVNGGYLLGSAPVRFPGSQLRLSADGRTVVVTLGAPDPRDVGGLGRVPVSSQPVFVPDRPSATDLAGNPLDAVGFADPVRSGF